MTGPEHDLTGKPGSEEGEAPGSGGCHRFGNLRAAVHSILFISG